CCGVVLRLPASYALARRRCAASISSLRCDRNASPRSFVHSRLFDMRSRTSGKTVRDFTLGSQSNCPSAVSRSAPWSGRFFWRHRSASTISSGYVEAISIWERTSSGYSAIGAIISSSCAWENLVSAPGAAPVTHSTRPSDRAAIVLVMCALEPHSRCFVEWGHPPRGRGFDHGRRLVVPSAPRVRRPPSFPRLPPLLGRVADREPGPLDPDDRARVARLRPHPEGVVARHGQLRRQRAHLPP